MLDLVNGVSTFLASLPSWGAATLIFFLSFITLIVVKRGVFFGFARIFEKTSFVLDSILLQASKKALNVFVFAVSIYVTNLYLKSLLLIQSDTLSSVNLLVKIIMIFALVLFVDKFIRLILNYYQTESPVLKTSGNLIKGTLRLMVMVLGILVILSTLGVSITPIVASLGIGSLAVALAIQPTLENFFSGIQILADKPIRVGDYIELDSGEQGFVELIGWRSVWIKMLPNNIVIMPNSLLAKSKIINYYYPEKQLSVPVECSVHYDSDLDEVERVVLDVARKILISHKWGIDDYDTFVVFHTFDSSSINFTVMLRAQEYFNRFFIKSEFMKALHKRFKQEGIVIPYPINAVNLSQEQSQGLELNTGVNTAE